MKSILRLPVAGLARAVFARSSTLRHLLFLLPLLPLALALPAAAQSRGFFLPDNQDEVLVGEAAGFVTLFVGRCCAAELPAATVELVTIEGSATEGSDYTPVRTSLVFAAGQTNRAVQIPVLDDGLVEGAETFQVRLQNPTGGTPLDPHNVACVRIVDDDRGFFLPATLYADEPRGLEVTVQRAGGPGLPAASVELVTADGTAKAGEDYKAVKTTVRFAAGQTWRSVAIPLLGDDLVEGPETFTVTLQNPTGGTPLDPAHTATVTIQDDDRGFNFGTASGGGVEDDGSVGIGVYRAGSKLPAATVELVTADGTAKAGLDYTAVKTNLNFAVGQSQLLVPIPVLNDALIEPQETFTVQLRNPVGFSLDPKDTTLTVFILDNDRGFVVRWAPSSSRSVRENESAARFEVAIVGDFALTTEAAVTVTTQDGTAKAGADYQATSARLVFAPGERVKSFDVPILNDALAEGDETFFVALSQPEGLPISDRDYESRLPVNLVDNELGYRLGESTNPGQAQKDYVFSEGATARVTVWRDGDFDISSTVKLSLANHNDNFGEEGTATPGTDFPTNSLVVTFGPGETQKTVTFDLPDDGVSEPEKTFFLALEAVGGAVPVQQSYARAFIRAYILDSGVLPALVDPDFDVKIPASGDAYYYHYYSLQKWVAQADGKIVYVADRVGYDGHRGSVILRLLPNGQLDPAWHPTATLNEVRVLALAPGGGIVVAQYPNGEEDASNHQLFRLHADGTRDTAFNPTTDGATIRSLHVYPDGRVLVVYPDKDTLGRFLANGRTDPAFIAPDLGQTPRTVQVDATNNIFILFNGGDLVRLKPDGTRDPAFNGSEYGDIQSILPLPDGRLLIHAQSLSPEAASRAVIRLRSNGTTDPSFAIQPTGDSSYSQYYFAWSAASDGTIWLLRLSSNFPLLGWYLERLLPDGSSDPAWSSQQVFAPGQSLFPPELKLVPLPNGELLVINAQLVNGQPRHRVAKLRVNPGLRVIVASATARIPESAGNATLQLLRSGPITNALTLGWATEPITAVPGADYTQTSGTVAFPAGRRDASITVPVLDNDLPDRDRLVRLRFTAAPGAPVPPPAGFAIANDDLGFPPDGIRVLSDGSVLLRPTGWLEASAASFHWWWWMPMTVQAGSLEGLRIGNYAKHYVPAEPYPELIVSPDDSGAVFFRVVDPNPAP